MVSSEELPPRVLRLPRSFWPRNLAAAIIATLIATGVSFLGRRFNWPKPEAVGFAGFCFSMIVLQPEFPGQRYRQWWSRIILGLVTAAIGASLYALIVNS